MRWHLVDRLLECEPGVSAVGIKTFSRSEVFFMDHFPGYPIVPGVLQIEMMAATGGKSIKMAVPHLLPVLGSVKNAKFYRQVQPGDQCKIFVKVVRLKPGFAVTEAHVEVDGVKVSSAQIFYAMLPGSVVSAGHVDAVIADFQSRNKAQTPAEKQNDTADLV